MFFYPPSLTIPRTPPFTEDHRQSVPRTPDDYPTSAANDVTSAVSSRNRSRSSTKSESSSSDSARPGGQAAEPDAEPPGSASGLGGQMADSRMGKRPYSAVQAGMPSHMFYGGSRGLAHRWEYNEGLHQAGRVFQFTSGSDLLDEQEATGICPVCMILMPPEVERARCHVCSHELHMGCLLRADPRCPVCRDDFTIEGHGVLLIATPESGQEPATAFLRGLPPTRAVDPDITAAEREADTSAWQVIAPASIVDDLDDIQPREVATLADSLGDSPIPNHLAVPLASIAVALGMVPAPAQTIEQEPVPMHIGTPGPVFLDDGSSSEGDHWHSRGQRGQTAGIVGGPQGHCTIPSRLL